MKACSIRLFFVICILAMMLCGCGGNSLYGEDGAATLEQLSEKESLASGEVAITFWDLPEVWYNFGIMCKRWAPVLICSCLLVGIVLMELFKKNKEVQKWVLSFLIIRIPLVTFILVYVYCLLYGAFNL